MATKCAINGRQWGAYDGRRHTTATTGVARATSITGPATAARGRADVTTTDSDVRATRRYEHIGAGPSHTGLGE